MIDKGFDNAVAALSDLKDGDSVMVGGFGSAGLPTVLVEAVLECGTKDLTVISNNAGYDRHGVAVLIAAGRVRKLVCSYPLSVGATSFLEAYAAGTIDLEVVPQGTLVERIRCAGAGLGGFLSPVGVGSLLSEGKPIYRRDGEDYVIEFPLHADFALIRARVADRMGNPAYHLSGMNFNPVMATAARTVVAEVDDILQPGEIDPASVGTPGIFVDRLVRGRERQA